MSVSQDQVVDYIKNLRLAEVKALIEVLETELGVVRTCTCRRLRRRRGPGLIGVGVANRQAVNEGHGHSDEEGEGTSPATRYPLAGARAPQCARPPVVSGEQDGLR